MNLIIIFCNVGSSLSKKLLPNNSLLSFSDYLPNSIANSFVCETITELEVYNAAVKFAAKSSAGPDVFSAKLILDVSSSIIPILCKIYNLSLESGIFPSELKISKVIPIFKKGERTEMGNYRPISLIKTFSKIFEYIVASRVNSFFTKYNLFYEYQFGFRSKYSTNLALLNTVDDIMSLLDQKSYVAGIFFDLSKAFDSIDHNILLKKLYYYGVRGQMHS